MSDQPELLDWQAIRYGDSPETRAALRYYRERGWPVDDPTWDGRVIDVISAYKSGFRLAKARAVDAEESARYWRTRFDATRDKSEAEVTALRADLTRLLVYKAGVEQSFNLCERHQPEAWEGDGTCTICEAVKLQADLSRVQGENETLRARLGESVLAFPGGLQSRAQVAEAKVAALTDALARVQGERERLQRAIDTIKSARSWDDVDATLDSLRQPASPDPQEPR